MVTGAGLAALGKSDRGGGTGRTRIVCASKVSFLISLLRRSLRQNSLPWVGRDLGRQPALSVSGRIGTERGRRNGDSRERIERWNGIPSAVSGVTRPDPPACDWMRCRPLRCPLATLQCPLYLPMEVGVVGAMTCSRFWRWLAHNRAR